MVGETSGGIEIRPINPEELDTFRYVTRTVFALDGTNPEREPATHMRPEWTTCAFEDGALCATFAAWPFSMRINGARIAVAGVTAVGTLPHRRRRGFLRRIMTRAFREQRERGQSIAILHASLAAIYQRFGYAVASIDHHYQIDPREIRFASGPEPAGAVRLSDATEQPLLHQIYRAFIEPRNGQIHRGKTLWQSGVLDSGTPGSGPIHVAVYEEAGEALGYVVYTNRDTGESGGPRGRTQQLTVRDMAWLAPQAYVAIWRHLAQHDLVQSVQIDNAPEDDPIFHLLEEPLQLHRRSCDGILLRVIDVERALPQRPYGAAASLTFEVTDPDCDWNNGVWELETDGPLSEVRRTQRSPQLRIPIHALSAMLNGFLAPSALADIGRLTVAEHAALEEWDRAFLTHYRPHCSDSF